MTPTLKPERLVLATGYFRSLAPEQIVVIHHQGLDKIKRIQKIQAGRIFVIGDNPRASLDSRSFGWLPLDRVVGRVIWPRH